MLEIILVLSGVAAGLVNAVAGGGVLFVFPVLLFAGVSPLAAAMTCTFAAWPGSVMSVFGYRKDLAKVPKQYFWLIVPCVFGGGIGATLLASTSNNTFEMILPWLILLAVLLFAFQPQLHRYIHRPVHLRNTSPFTLLMLLLVPVALYGGYFGAGFGFIVLAILGFTRLKNVYQINGMKNLITASIAFTGGVVFTLAGGVAWEFVPLPLLGSLAGGLLGSRLAHHMSPHLTRAVVVVIGLFVVGSLFVDVY